MTILKFTHNKLLDIEMNRLFMFSLRKVAFLSTACAFLVVSTTACHAGIMLDISGGRAASDNRTFMLGYDFTVTGPMTINGIGVWDEGSNGLTQSVQVGLWDANGALLRSAFASSASDVEASGSINGQWLFEDVADLTLNSGRYTVAYLRPGGSDLWRFGVAPTTIAQVTMGRQLELLTGAFQVPTGQTGFNEGHFGPNLRFQSAPVPEPTSLAIFGTICLLGFGRRRKS